MDFHALLMHDSRQLADFFKEFSMQQPLILEGPTFVEHVLSVGIRGLTGRGYENLLQWS